jgi:hypothetical protein
MMGSIAYLVLLDEVGTHVAHCRSVEGSSRSGG